MMLTEEKILLLNQVIELAERRNREHVNHTIDTSKPETLDFLRSDEYEKSNASDEAIYAYLMGLTFEEVKFVQTVMYIGRDESFEENITAERLYAEKYKSLHWATHDIEANMIVEKMPLDDYLRRGIKLIGSKS